MSEEAIAIPSTLSQRLQEFCAAGKSGNLQIDIKDGRISAAKLVESIRLIDKDKAASK